MEDPDIKPKSFEETYPRFSFSPLVRLGLVLARSLRRLLDRRDAGETVREPREAGNRAAHGRQPCRPWGALDRAKWNDLAVSGADPGRAMRPWRRKEIRPKSGTGPAPARWDTWGG